MDNSNLRFGEFIAKKRAQKEITLKVLSEGLGITPSYFSDIEKGRRNPPDLSMLEKLALILEISGEEKSLMFDLAGKDRKEVSPDLPEYIMSDEVIRATLREAKDVASVEDWKDFLEKLKKKRS